MSASRLRLPRWRLRTVLLLVNLLVLVLPLGSIGVLRLYENELIRRTEAELIAQGAFVSAIYLQALEAELDDAALSTYGVLADPETLLNPDDGPLHPFPPTIDRARAHVAPPAPDDLAIGVPDPAAAAIGRHLNPILSEIKHVTLAGVRVVDFRGVEVAATRFNEHRDMRAWSEVETALTGHRVAHLRERISDEPNPPLHSMSRRTRVRVFVAMPIVRGDRVVGAVVLSRTPMSLGKALYINQRIMLLTALFLLALVVGLSLFTSLTVARPVRELVGQAKAVAGGRSREVSPLRAPGTRELAELSEALTTMADTLAAREAYLRDFARGLSHEFKTPLTSMRGAIELLSDHIDEMSPEESGLFLATLQTQVARLTALVSRVLELARADVITPGAVSTQVAPVIARVENEADRPDRLSTRVEAPLGAVPMSADVLGNVLETLVRNALTHGGPAVRVWARRGDEVVVEVRDNGPEISEGNVARLFEAFFTTARDTGGTGLGLSIARSLVEGHGGTLRYVREGDETVFRVTLPQEDQPSSSA